MRLRDLLKSALVKVLYHGGLTAWARWRLRRQGAAIVLMFHRVLSQTEQDGSSSLSGIIINDRTYQHLLAYIQNTCETLDLSRGAPPRTKAAKTRVALTFDDGWSDNYGPASRAVSAHSLPMTIFVCPGLVGCANPFWPERAIALLRTAARSLLTPRLLQTHMMVHFTAADGAREARIESTIEVLKTLPPEKRDALIQALADALENDITAKGPIDATLGWDEIRQLAAAGVTFGSHTQTHQILTSIPPDAVRQELEHSASELRSHLPGRPTLFAYPNGSWLPEVRLAVEQAGYTLAFTTEPRAWTPECDPLLVPRVNIWEGCVTDDSGSFSQPMTEYVLFWKPYIATWRSQSRLTRNHRV